MKGAVRRCIAGRRCWTASPGRAQAERTVSAEPVAGVPAQDHRRPL